LRSYDIGSDDYIRTIKIILAVLIPVGYLVSCIGFLVSIPLVRRDLVGDVMPVGQVSRTRKMGF
jgi:hypothetical protein